jgi:hypothetical protein
MKTLKNLLLLVISIVSLNLYGQSYQRKTIPFLKTGYGYFNDGLMIDGNVLSGEIGIKLKTNYIFSLKMNFADAVNDIANYPDIQGVDWNFIYSYKWVTLNIGYEFMTKNHHHSFIPMMGPFYSCQLTTYPLLTDEGGLELRKNVRDMVGIDLSLQYLYNFKNGISVGLNGSGCLAFQYGPTYFTVMPVVAIKVE